ncbi:unnamed protein product [Owenia fusiformis]|uniref:Uncharacterized protein n=1 Tax=Owenia fusiformis TaxID=6347 RepID=A0A8J1XVH0_OWEFU|nr:unnamed protein product [Owenia fusiformis]
MTRHGKNSTAGSVYTYHERKKDTQQSGYGSKQARFGKDSIKEFDCCSLTLQPCKDPVVTIDGYLFDKEAILEYILHQKKEIARKLKEYAKQKDKLEEDVIEKARAEQAERTKAFVKTEGNILSKPIDPFHKKDGPKPGPSVSNMADGKDKKLPAFWLPSQLPEADKTLVKKPDEKVRCPMSDKVLKMKDLIPVNFTKINDRDEKTSLIAKKDRYVCAVTNDVLGNSTPCAVLRTSGCVVTMDCVEKLIKKDNPMLDPINGKPLRDKDIIPLQRGATGFSGAGITLEGKVDGPGLMS